MLALEQWAESGTFIAPGTGVVRPPPPLATGLETVQNATQVTIVHF